MRPDQPSARYRIGRLLGRGAVASVHEVFDDAGERFAGKFLHASRDGDAQAGARFQQEARLLAGIEHPNLVRVDGEAIALDAEGEPRTFVRMELVEGVGLDVLLAREGPLDARRTIEFGRQLAAGLGHAHTHGLVHRDLKPSNVLVGADASGNSLLKIADFGMARASSLSGLDASALTILGTPDYMAPESLDPLAVDARADLYALGCMLFEMLTGEVPYPAATPFGVLRRHRDDPLPPLDEGLEPELRAIILALLAKSPADRPASASLVAERLEALRNAARGSTSLVPTRLIASRCVSCGHALVEHISTCLNCGLAAVSLEPGSHSVIVTGPGEIGDKLDAGLREATLQWLADNPQLGLSAHKRLAKTIPRLPFVFTTAVSERCAGAMVSSLTRLGLAAEPYRRRLLTHTGLRSKVWKLSGRVGLIMLGATAGMWQNTFFLALIPVLGVVALSTTAWRSLRPATRSDERERDMLSSELRAAFDMVEGVAPALSEARHRHALRAVVRQSLELREQLGPERADAELASALRSASTTTAALARIDTQLRARDLAESDDETRALLHHRDQLAGRLAELSGALGSLRLRARRAQTQQSGAAQVDAQLEHLEAQVEALEELEREL